MIFKRWFKPKWQHQDAAVRQQAITELSATEAEHKNILHELAFNDGAEAVRRNALQKLNEFSLWWQTSKHDPAERLKLYAEQQLIDMLLQNKVSASLKQQFIAECNRSSILEQLAATETDATIKFALLQRLDRQELTLQSLHDEVLSLSQKQQLLAAVHDEKVLEKLSRLLPSELAQQARQQLEQFARQKQQPLILRKQLKLLLAQLNALRDKTDLSVIPTQFEQYQQQWHTLQPEFACLPVEEATEYQQKYQKISLQLQNWLQPRLAQLAQQQAEQQQQVAAQAYFLQLQQNLQQLQHEIQQALVQPEPEQQLPLLQQRLQQLQQESTTLLAASVRSGFQSELAKTEKQLQRLPRLVEQLTALKQLLAEWAEHTLPESAEAYWAVAPEFQQWQRQWQQRSRQLDLAIPEPLAQAYRQLQQQWQHLAGQYQAAADKQYKICRNKLAEFKRLYQQGRYKVLFGLFKGIEHDYQQLLANQQQQLEKEYQFATEKLAELADWQQYIATPRKQQLLTQIQQLAALEITDAKVRAAEVKQLRADWNTLGKAAPELEEKLNEAFDLACESAFAPCREYFARLDAEKAQHAAARADIIAQLAALLNGHTDTELPEAEFNKLARAWQQSGAVDKAQFQPLQQQYQPLQLAARKKLQQQRQQHADAKQKLITKAETALALEDANLAAKVLKECQSEWKTLGFAGKSQDQLLWQQFRQLCDGFFRQRQLQFDQQQHAQQQQQSWLMQQLEQLASITEQASTPAELDNISLQIQQLSETAGADKPLPALRQLQKKLQQKQVELQQATAETELQQLFVALRQPEAETAMPLAFRDSFRRQQTDNLSRAQLTLALEIIAARPSPAEDASSRQQVQLMLLSDKHNQGELPNLSQLLQRWVQYGPVSAAEMPLLQRIETVFIN